MGIKKKKSRKKISEVEPRKSKIRVTSLRKKLASILEEMDKTQSEKAAEYFAEIIDLYYSNAQIEDVLADIQHWCAEYEIDFEDALAVSRLNYIKEREIHNKIMNETIDEV